MRKDFQDQFGNFVRVKVQPETRVRLRIARLRHLGGNRKSDREHQHARRIVFVDLFSNDHALRSLHDDAQSW